MRGGGSVICVICDMTKLLYATIEMVPVQCCKKYSPETSHFSDDIA